ncbi:hypothetical protein Tco_1215084 [Tanacetum coccineum]
MDLDDTSGSDCETILPSSDDLSPIFEEKSVTFSNSLFDLNDFTSSNNESLSDEDVLKDVKIYSNPLFEFDDEYISSDVNPLFDEVLEDIECKDSYDSNLDESTFLVTPLSDYTRMNLDFTPSHDFLGSGNKIFDSEIFIEVQSWRLLSRDEFSISFIRDPLSLVFDTLLSFLSENENKVFNPGILFSSLLSHRGKITYDSSESPMMISGGDIPLLDVPYLHFYPP